MDILLVEDQPVVSEATVQKLRLTPGIGHIEIRDTAESALLALREEPDRWGLIFLDLEVPGAVGLSLAMEIKKLGKAGITCVVTGKEHTDFIAQVKAEGFRGYILKSSVVRDLEIGLAKVIAGETIFPDESASAEAVRLTTHQKECLRLVGEGLTSKEIARIRKVHPSTVNYHLDSAVAQLKAINRHHAVHVAVALGIITLNLAPKNDDAD
jgi:two-component system, NarL family, response regulator DesR